MRAGAVGRRVGALLGFATLWAILCAAPVLAHAELLRATPAEGGTLSEQPGEVRLVFDEPVRAEFAPVKVTDAGGDRVDDGEADTSTRDPDVVVAPLGELPAGDYTVEWRVTSADGDPISGEYRFSVDESAVGGSAGEGNGGPNGGPSGGEEAGSGGVSAGLILGVLVVGGIAVAGFVKLRGR